MPFVYFWFVGSFLPCCHFVDLPRSTRSIGTREEALLTCIVEGVTGRWCTNYYQREIEEVCELKSLIDFVFNLFPTPPAQNSITSIDMTKNSDNGEMLTGWAFDVSVCLYLFDDSERAEQVLNWRKFAGCFRNHIKLIEFFCGVDWAAGGCVAGAGSIYLNNVCNWFSRHTAQKRVDRIKFDGKSNWDLIVGTGSHWFMRRGWLYFW